VTPSGNELNARLLSVSDALVPCVNNSHSALSTEATFSGETGVDVDGTYLCVAACCD